MQFDTFKNYVAGYMNRVATDFVVNGVDILADAINDARRAAQRDIDFVACQCQGFMTIANGGTSLSTMKTTPGGATSIAVKKVKAVWTYANNGGVYQRTGQLLPVANHTELVTELVTMEGVGSASTKGYFYQQGETLFMVSQGPVDVLCDVVKWMPDGSGTSEDFLLTDYKDYILLKTVEQLNFFVKEDQRVQISQGAMRDRLDSVLRRENNYTNFEYYATLN